MRHMNHNRKRRDLHGPVHLLFLCSTLLLLASCSTQKAKWANIRYHNLTCHYNVWWNGNESLKAGREKLYKSAVDDYTRLLPPEKTGSEEDARNIYPEMDRAIEKGIKGIHKHSIIAKGEEKVPYIKECYLLTAYASFYKHDYVSATNACYILTDQFPGTRAADEGAVLMARCMTREKRYKEAEDALDQLVTNLGKGNFSRSQRGKLYSAMVEATLPQEKYKKAVEYIHLATDNTRSRREKARLTFLLAQIYQQLDKRSVAAKYYHKVLGYGPEYVMEFNARLGEASCADLEHSDIAKLERQLDAMLDDKKNEEYRDQIYFAKGEMYLGAKDAKKACDNYRLSVAVSKNNKAQKARSAIRMGEVLYELYENYDLAQKYYDTAIHIINQDYPRYKSVKRRYDILTELCSFTRVFQRNDSLLAIAAMPEKQRLEIINAQIDSLKRQEEKAREKALLEEMMADNKAQLNTLTGDWYFYNSNSLQKGKDTFRQRWGLRPLEDNWFLSNKSMIGASLFADGGLPDDDDGDDATQQADDSTDTTLGPTSKSQYGNPDDPHDVAYYLKDLPATPQAVDSLDSLTSYCLLGAGYIFYDGIGNTPRALDCYLRLAKDYTSYGEIVQAFYMLYRIYDRQGNTPQANYYRDMVLMGFPDSDFANLIRDNEYYKELIARDQRVEKDYEEIYDLFARQRYRSVVTLADQADEDYPSSPLLHKFHYWKGLALANLGNREMAISTFESIVRSCDSKDSIVPLAQIQLDLLRSRTDSILASSDETITPDDEKRLREKNRQLNQPASDKPQASTGADAKPEEQLPQEALVYRYRDNQQHYVIVIVNDRTVRATELQYRLSDFNSQYYANSGYKVNALLFTDTTQILTIHRFTSADEAMNYYRHLQQQESPLQQLNPSDHVEFAISTQNYATFYNRKKVDAYYAFFRKYYLKQ